MAFISLLWELLVMMQHDRTLQSMMYELEPSYPHDLVPFPILEMGRILWAHINGKDGTILWAVRMPANHPLDHQWESCSEVLCRLPLPDPDFLPSFSILIPSFCFFAIGQVQLQGNKLSSFWITPQQSLSHLCFLPFSSVLLPSAAVKNKTNYQPHLLSFRWWVESHGRTHILSLKNLEDNSLLCSQCHLFHCVYIELRTSSKTWLSLHLLHRLVLSWPMEPIKDTEIFP